ncbi:bifunctional 4-hydroxy-2-oxoglutarate aldolase/2-dehydro-3-deoxy-phosphogluconate aldolase [Shewanella intestini]|uniref:2-dehydro-3-deoxy-phosphogluconate aldolase n=1 Tax=Shewanella intestini TaxID=2017544 RepID=A0ABS5I1J7_9GAMM|nr:MULTISPECIES: bifunctional 4-hydroxy-2-oxoglutarate aldolase/2-dehydro-3-deoxy-phosphogluconate aldolase [Shewanella]MBR9727892.1 bifunctional 4-hydroxy-2-oxoglutarate aldolase/2-dehydro-3-deoxy-phosphogluconate aldolase [Shewanella intestini]MRG36115.1 bifunctional 4-hydroxy-2-oxoglutarate aldolase/2-dehydro-3-deoxy-phosphogluconate aldolase [Shewanella sp. XMDDZSB0408]
MSNTNWMTQPADIFKRSPIVPVMVIEDLDDAVPLAKALVAGGISVLEVTLRTPCALAAIAKIVQEVPEAIVGAGTILNEAQLQQAIDAGSQFIITPGSTVDILHAAKKGQVPLIPGVASISEVMVGMELGYTHFKFFPAEASGGVNALKSFAGPLADIRFCPTGGIGPSSYQAYLALSNVDCIGGSWIAPTDAVKAKDWSRITQLCQQALAAL